MAASQPLRLEVILAAIDRATGPFKRILGGSTALGRSIKATNARLKQLGEQQASITAFRKLKNETTQTGTALRAAQQKATRMRAEMAAMESPTRKATAALARQERATDKLKMAHQANLRAVRTGRQALTAAGIAARDLGAHERRLRTEIAATTQAMKAQQTRLGALQRAQQRGAQLHAAGMKATLHGAGAAYGGQRVLRAAVVPAAAAVQFESEMADVRKVVDFDTPQQFAQMGRDIEDLSMRLPMAAADIAKIVAAAGQANIARGELLQFASDATKMGVAFDTTAEDAGQTMATWRTAFRMGQRDVVVLADKINYLGNTGPASVQKISDVVNRIGALGDVAGLKSGPLAALGATIAGMGIQSEVSATGIKNMLLTLSSGEAATKRQLLAFKTLGIDAVKMSKAMQDDAGGAILSVLDKLRQLPEAEQSAVMTRLFGRESVGAIAPLLTNLELLRENLDKVTDASKYAGSMEKEYASRVSTSENALQLAKNTVVVLAQSIGKTLIPNIKELAGRVGALVGRVVEWIRANPGLTRALALTVIGGAALVTVLGGLLVAGGLAAMALGQIHSAVALLSGGRGIVQLIGGLSRLGPLLAGIALPALPVLAVIAAIAAGALLVWKYWQPISAFLTGMWQGISQAMEPVIATLSSAFAPLAPLWDVIAGAMGRVWGIALQLLAPFHATSEQLQGATQNGVAFGRLVGGALTILLRPLTTFMRGLKALEGLFATLRARMPEIGAALMQGLANGLLGGLSGVGKAVAKVSSSVVGWLKQRLGIHSPSRVFAKLGDFTMQGFAGGLDRSGTLPVRAMQAVAASLRKVGAGAALGAAALPAVAIDTRPPVTSAGARPAERSRVYQISINAGGDARSQDIAAEVRAAIEQIERERGARKRSALSDYE